MADVDLQYSVLQASRLGDSKSLKSIIDSHPHLDDVNFLDEGGLSPLMHAVVGSAESAGRHLQCIELLLSLGAALDFADISEGRTALHWAVISQREDMVGVLVSNGADPTTPDYHGQNAIHLAVAQHSTACLIIFIQNLHVDLLQIPDGQGLTPLVRAIEGNDAEACHLLIYEAHVDPNLATESNGWTALHWAAYFEQADVLAFLLKSGADPGIGDVERKTVAHVAAVAKSPDCVSVVLKLCGSELFEVGDVQGVTPLMLACEAGNESHIGKMMKKKVNGSGIDFQGQNALHWCKDNQIPGCVRSVAKYWPSLVNQPDNAGRTSLHHAAMSGNAVATEAMSRIPGVNLNSVEKDKRTALHWATVSGHVDVVYCLAEAGAELSSPDINGAYPLHYTAQLCGSVSQDEDLPARALECLTVLLEKGADPDVRDPEGRTPLMWAANTGGTAEACHYLASRKADVNAKDGIGMTALHTAVNAGQFELCFALVKELQADVNACDASQRTPLFYAVSHDFPDIVGFLLDSKADPDILDKDKMSVAHVASTFGYLNCLEMIQSYMGHLDLTSDTGAVPLHEAASNGHLDCVEFLLIVGCTSDPRDKDGVTPLHFAAAGNFADVCQALLTAGADANVTVETSEGFLTPLDYAENCQAFDAVSLLKAAGGRRGQIKQKDEERSEIIAGSGQPDLTEKNDEEPAEKIEEKEGEEETLPGENDAEKDEHQTELPATEEMATHEEENDPIVKDEVGSCTVIEEQTADEKGESIGEEKERELQEGDAVPISDEQQTAHADEEDGEELVSKDAADGISEEVNGSKERAETELNQLVDSEIPKEIPLLLPLDRAPQEFAEYREDAEGENVEYAHEIGDVNGRENVEDMESVPPKKNDVQTGGEESPKPKDDDIQKFKPPMIIIEESEDPKAESDVSLEEGDQESQPLDKKQVPTPPKKKRRWLFKFSDESPQGSPKGKRRFSISGRKKGKTEISSVMHACGKAAVVSFVAAAPLIRHELVSKMSEAIPGVVPSLPLSDDNTKEEPVEAETGEVITEDVLREETAPDAELPLIEQLKNEEGKDQIDYGEDREEITSDIEARMEALPSFEETNRAKETEAEMLEAEKGVEIEVESPALVGSGRETFSEAEVVKDDVILDDEKAEEMTKQEQDDTERETADLESPVLETVKPGDVDLDDTEPTQPRSDVKPNISELSLPEQRRRPVVVLSAPVATEQEEKEDLEKSTDTLLRVSSPTSLPPSYPVSEKSLTSLIDTVVHKMERAVDMEEANAAAAKEKEVPEKPNFLSEEEALLLARLRAQRERPSSAAVRAMKELAKAYTLQMKMKRTVEQVRLQQECSEKARRSALNEERASFETSSQLKSCEDRLAHVMQSFKTITSNIEKTAGDTTVENQKMSDVLAGVGGHKKPTVSQWLETKLMQKQNGMQDELMHWDKTRSKRQTVMAVEQKLSSERVGRHQAWEKSRKLQDKIRLLKKRQEELISPAAFIFPERPMRNPYVYDSFNQSLPEIMPKTISSDGKARRMKIIQPRKTDQFPKARGRKTIIESQQGNRMERRLPVLENDKAQLARDVRYGSEELWELGGKIATGNLKSSSKVPPTSRRKNRSLAFVPQERHKPLRLLSKQSEVRGSFSEELLAIK